MKSDKMNIIGNDKRVLIIEDSIDMQSLLKLILEGQGYLVECRSNGEEALQMLNSCNQLPDLILLDLRMPIMDGYDFIKLKKQISRFNDIPVVVMTGEDDSEGLSSSGQAHNILRKPLSMLSVIETVARNFYLH